MEVKTILLCGALSMIILLAVIPTAQSQTTLLADNPDMAKECICPAVYCPVCGSDGKTYSNICALNCQTGVFCVCGDECGSDNCKKTPPKACPLVTETCSKSG